MKFKKHHFFNFILLFLLIIFALFYSYNNSISRINTEQFNVHELSSEKVVIDYLKKHHKLPDYFISKKEARRSGWKPEKGNLCDILPGKVIGGDIFYNRQQAVPSRKGRKWFEADINYNCGGRGKDRLVFSNDGLIFVTYDHYNNFQQR